MQRLPRYEGLHGLIFLCLVEGARLRRAPTRVLTSSQERSIIKLNFRRSPIRSSGRRDCACAPFGLFFIPLFIQILQGEFDNFGGGGEGGVGGSNFDEHAAGILGSVTERD